MQNLPKIICLLLINLSFSFAQENKNQNVTVNVSNLNSNDGKVFIAIYDSKDSFLNKGFKSYVTKIENYSCSLTFENIPSGNYAISLYHDENDNNKMDSNFMGIPKEDYGCSNNAKGFMGPPKWEDAKFEINNKPVIQNIQL
ncbi:DUF2141 domain-containing protein [Litoribaculum gwangyangense]|uniref:DUF2141 domain-containing protein n=1 Tax=Litoribaculum gwangyangense TaxID=1130722 RepID=A0ABP9CR11_9FLAO